VQLDTMNRGGRPSDLAIDDYRDLLVMKRDGVCCRNLMTVSDAASLRTLASTAAAKARVRALPHLAPRNAEHGRLQTRAPTRRPLIESRRVEGAVNRGAR
jgi:hypothetical protein